MAQEVRGTRGEWARSRQVLVAAAAFAAMAHALALEALPASGVAADTPAAAGPRLSLATPTPLPSSSIPPGQDVGLQFRQALAGGGSIDVTAWRRVQQQPAPPDALSLIEQREPYYGARVEMRLKPSKGLVTEFKSLGVQLDNGARIMLRRKNGAPTLYYRSEF